MEIEEFERVLESYAKKLNARDSNRLKAEEERNAARAIAGAWFRSYRARFAYLLKDETALAPLDESFQKLIQLATGVNLRSSYQKAVQRARTYFRKQLVVPLSQALWKAPAVGGLAGYSEELAKKLEALDPHLRDSYETVVADLNDGARKSFKGSANELREILREVLHRLAPNEDVEREQWYRDSRRGKPGANPSHADRTKYILQRRKTGSAVVASAQEHGQGIEERLARIVRITYDRASASTHVRKARQELHTQLGYLNVLLLELLPE